jgi:actin-binding protein anillin
VKKQVTVMSQASQELNLCYSTIEFSGSAEQVEGERLLLVASKYHFLVLSQLRE